MKTALKECGDKKLISWVRTQRSLKSDGKLQPEREALLNSIGFNWNRDVTDNKLQEIWRGMYEKLKQYHKAHGDSDVPCRSKENPKLATWVATQRARKKQGDLSDEQIQLLEKLGFTWKSRDRGTWDDRLAEVAAFKEKNGHCEIPLNYPENPKLGHFVNAMRTQRNSGKLDADRITKLRCPWLCLGIK